MSKPKIITGGRLRGEAVSLDDYLSFLTVGSAIEFSTGAYANSWYKLKWRSKDSPLTFAVLPDYDGVVTSHVMEVFYSYPVGESEAARALVRHFRFADDYEGASTLRISPFPNDVDAQNADRYLILHLSPEKDPHSAVVTIGRLT